MKIAGDPLQYCKAIPKGIRAVLLYGPNRVLIDEAVQVAQKSLLPSDTKNDFSVVTVTPEKRKQNPAMLAEEFTSFGFFAAQKVIHFKEAGDGDVKALQSALAGDGAGHFLIIEGGELTPKSPLRAWAEKANDIAAIACYALEGRNLQAFITAQFAAENARVQSDAAALLTDRLGGDLAPLRNIVRQLVDYAGQNVPITADHVEALLVDQTEQEVEAVVQSVADGAMPQLDRALHNLHASGTSMVTVLRMLQYYFYRLRSVQAAVNNGDSVDAAMARLRPPVFFKIKPAFNRHLRNWNLARLDRALHLFTDLEAQCKKTGTPEVLLVQQRLILLAREGAQVLRTRSGG